MATIQQPEIPAQTAIGLELTPELLRKQRGQFRIILERFMANKPAIAGVVVLLIILVLALAAPIITHQTATYDPPNTPNIDIQFQGSTGAHLLGTDELGRDILARLLFGARVSLLVGFLSMAVAIFIGVTVGAIAGYFGGMIDNLMMRITDVFLSLPSLLLLFVLSATFANGTVFSIVVIIAALSWTITARIVRSEFQSLKQREFLLASRTLGAGNMRLMLRHILPNAAGPIIVAATLLVGNNIITESILSFFGFGLNPPQSSWGVMLAQSQDFFQEHASMLILPGLAILVTVLCFNLMGDGLRDALDPYMTER